MGYKMNISSLRKAFIFMGAVAALSLVNAQSALAANESAKDMTCQEFIDLNPYLLFIMQGTTMVSLEKQ
ncbi:hypothetical protein EIMP300_13980 [Escherichia coli]|uniref:Acid-resistance protein n=1 Tax=Escherichia coli TaxID=562 RepID=A0A8S0FI44_ECOLX|nr:hypothetical protein EIMP300_13980 [Escherichia coli]